jgi:hypothetical protein
VTSADLTRIRLRLELEMARVQARMRRLRRAVAASLEGAGVDPADFGLPSSTDAVDELVSNAARGEPRAVGAIAVVFGKVLVREARKELGPMFEGDAWDVVDQFLWELLREKLPFPPIRGAAVAWMKRMVRETARKHLAERGRGRKEAG